MATLSRERRIRALGWSLFVVLAVWFLAAGWPLWSLAFAQDAPVAVAPAVATDPLAAALLALLQGGGLPAVLILAIVQARSLLAAGIPVTVQLSTEDRARIDRLIRAVRQREDDSDEPPVRTR